MVRTGEDGKGGEEGEMVGEGKMMRWWVRGR